MKMTKKIGYSEPADYFPKSVRKKLEKAEKTDTKKKVKRTKKK